MCGRNRSGRHRATRTTSSRNDASMAAARSRGSGGEPAGPGKSGGSPYRSKNVVTWVSLRCLRVLRRNRSTRCPLKAPPFPLADVGINLASTNTFESASSGPRICIAKSRSVGPSQTTTTKINAPARRRQPPPSRAAPPSTPSASPARRPNPTSRTQTRHSCD